MTDHTQRARAFVDTWGVCGTIYGNEKIRARTALAAEFAAVEREALERAASVVDECNRESAYNAIGAASRIRALIPTGPRDPDPTREGIFRDHNCARCDDGAKPCVGGNPRNCEYPHARND